MTSRRAWTGDEYPPPFQRPPDGEPVDPGTLLGLWLDSIPVAPTAATVTYGNQGPPPPLTEEEQERVADYLSSRWGPAADAERRQPPTPTGKDT